MYRSLSILFILVATQVHPSVCSQVSLAQDSGVSSRQRMNQYIASRVERIEAGCLQGLNTAKDWQERRPGLVHELKDMLGLVPWPEDSDLKPTIVGRDKYEGYAVERLHFQSRPGLYVTANLYVPTAEEGPFPTVLYVCGHGRVKVDGVSFGNKVSYHHHGVWFARNGYVCMVIDTIQLGEIEGMHHGTYRYGRWWWPSRSYTPAGVEAFNSVRALDYLETRPEVDSSRFGITGRSGGGAYSWWAAAIDERIKVVVPVAGITDMRNYVIDGCIEGHCDCMFMVNKYKWDFATVAALVAPRPLLIANSHKDSIFPLDGVMRVFNQTQNVYEVLGAGDNLAVHITEGPHKDTQVLRVGAFAWFEKHLKGSTDEIEEVARKVHQPADLQVFSAGIPEDERVTDADDSFVANRQPPKIPKNEKQWLQMRGRWRERLDRVPGATKRLDGFELVWNGVSEDGKLEFETTIPLQTHVRMSARASADDGIQVQVQYEEQDPASENGMDFVLQVQGVGDSSWNEDERQTTHLRRRLHLVGESLDAIRASEIRAVVDAIRANDQWKDKTLSVYASGKGACLAMLAAIGNEAIDELALRDLPADLTKGPIMLGLLQAVDLPRVAAMAAEKHRLRIDDSAPMYLKAVADAFGWEFVIED